MIKLPGEKNLILVKGLCLHLEVKSEASIAKLTGLEGCVEHAARTDCGQRQLPPGRLGQSSARQVRAEEREALPVVKGPIHREASGLNRLVF